VEDEKYFSTHLPIVVCMLAQQFYTSKKIITCGMYETMQSSLSPILLWLGYDVLCGVVGHVSTKA
jgi:hypothetical protein